MIRIVHESEMHDKTAFLTLTYNEQQLPDDGSLDKERLKKFFSDLRNHFREKRLRYFAVGEYGEQLNRPHYHVILFGESFEDKYQWRFDKGYWLYRSPSLEKIWRLGNSEIGTVTHKSAGYCAQYVQKKVNGERALSHYRRTDPETGEQFNVAPEFALMSLRPGIGATWFDTYSSDVFPADSVVIDGREYPPPDYYLDRYAKKDPEAADAIRAKRRQAVKEYDTYDPERLEVKEYIATLKHEAKERSYESL